MLTPTRDVDVVYMMVQAGAPGGPRVVEERMRWAAAAGKLRIDPPTRGMWVVMDTGARRISTVREADRSVLDIEARARPCPALPCPAARRRSSGAATDSVAGVPCTEWQTSDVTGTPTLACITADGVLLRASAAGRVLVEALHLAYAPQDPAVFRIPAGLPENHAAASETQRRPDRLLTGMTPTHILRNLAVWRDPAGRFSPLKAATLLLVLCPAAELGAALGAARSRRPAGHRGAAWPGRLGGALPAAVARGYAGAHGARLARRGAGCGACWG